MDTRNWFRIWSYHNHGAFWHMFGTVGYWTLLAFGICCEFQAKRRSSFWCCKERLSYLTHHGYKLFRFYGIRSFQCNILGSCWTRWPRNCSKNGRKDLCFFKGTCWWNIGDTREIKSWNSKMIKGMNSFHIENHTTWIMCAINTVYRKVKKSEFVKRTNYKTSQKGWSQL